jgi:GT2 family glycosyltransferase
MFAYVILHYKTFDLTKECVEKILGNFPESKVVIVDNFSNDGSAEKLRENFPSVSVISTEKNLGFAKGNNTGYEFVKKNFNADFVVVMNNDVMIDDKDFEKKILEKHFDITGPDIITPEEKHQNPLLKQPYSTSKILKLIVIDSLRLLCLKTGLFQKKILNTYNSASQKFYKESIKLENKTDCVLHGACVVYSKKWIENEEFAFLPITFLYGEEMLLYDYAKKKGYKTGVSEGAKVLHLGGKSTLTDLNAKDRQIFKTKMRIKAFFLIINNRFFL